MALGLLFAFIPRLGAQTNEIPIPTEEIELHDRGANCCGPIASLHLFPFSCLNCGIRITTLSALINKGP